MNTEATIDMQSRVVNLYFEFKDESIMDNEIQSLINEAMLVAKAKIGYPGGLKVSTQPIDSIENEFGFCIKRPSIYDAKSMKAQMLLSAPSHLTNEEIKAHIKSAYIEVNAFDALNQAAITVEHAS